MTARYEVVITPAEETFEKRPLYSLWKREEIQSGPCKGQDTNTLLIHSYNREDLLKAATAIMNAVTSIHGDEEFLQSNAEG